MPLLRTLRRPFEMKLTESSTALVRLNYMTEGRSPAAPFVFDMRVCDFPTKSATLICDFFNFHYPLYGRAAKRNADGTPRQEHEPVLPRRMHDLSLVFDLNKESSWNFTLHDLDIEDLEQATGAVLELDEHLAGEFEAKGVDEMHENDRVAYELQMAEERERLTNIFRTQAHEQLEESIMETYDSHHDERDRTDLDGYYQEQAVTAETPCVTIKLYKF